MGATLPRLMAKRTSRLQGFDGFIAPIALGMLSLLIGCS
jgi:hypothetical protein